MTRAVVYTADVDSLEAYADLREIALHAVERGPLHSTIDIEGAPEDVLAVLEAFGYGQEHIREAQHGT